MSDLLKWSPFDSVRLPSPDEPGMTPSYLMAPVERLFDSTDIPAPIRVEEFVDDNTLVVRAEIPGVDPDKDIEVSVADGVLRIRAERQERENHLDRNLIHSELRYGSFTHNVFTRNVPLPEGAKDEDIKASYKDGVLEVRTPLPRAGRPGIQEKRLPISRD